MSNTALTTKLASLPTQPGIYQFQDAKGGLLYVGKAKNLRNRVRSYFQSGRQLDDFKEEMVNKVADLETITTDTETEALVLEANLIREHQPPYNVLLRDDKFYLFIKITKDNPPRIFPVRKTKRDGARYFGPYSSASSVRKTLRLLQRLFPFEGEKKSPREQVFPHPLFTLNPPTPLSGGDETTSPFPDKGRGQGGWGLSSAEEVDNIIAFLKGDRDHIMKTLRRGMKEASQNKQFERAAIFRDQLQAIERLEGSQKVFLPSKESFDAISLAHDQNKSAANLFTIRKGKLLGKNTFLLNHQRSATKPDILRQFLLQYYSAAQDIPPKIFVPLKLADADSLSNWIEAKIKTAQRGTKKKLITMGEHNAAGLLLQEKTAWDSAQRADQATQELATALNLESKLARIETYDISNIQGTLTTGSMIVFKNGKPSPKDYKRFRIKTDEVIKDGIPNDFAALQQVLSRRFATKHNDWPKPDLVLIDGGKGQLNAVNKVLKKGGEGVHIASLAKREEELFIPGKSDPIRLPYDSDALYLIQQMRDEAHRFTITYHRLLRSKKQQRSILDEIPGIGPKTKKKLLNHFGSLKNIRAATQKQIESVIGSKTDDLKDYL